MNTEIYEIPVSPGNVKPLTARVGPDGSPAVSPDGSKIAYLGYDDKLLSYQNARLYVMDRDGRNSRSLTDALDRTIDSADWAADGRSLYVQYDDAAVTKVARVALNGRMEPIAQGLSGGGFDRPYTGGQFSVSADGSVAYSGGAGGQPSDVFIARKGRSRQLTRLNAAFLAGKTLGEVLPLTVKSSVDQRPIGAWLVTPPNFDRLRKYPLILEIHGGPYAAYGPVFSTDNQLYAAAGTSCSTRILAARRPMARSLQISSITPIRATITMTS